MKYNHILMLVLLLSILTTSLLGHKIAHQKNSKSAKSRKTSQLALKGASSAAGLAKLNAKALLSTSTFTRVDDIAVGSDGEPWAVNDDGLIYRRLATGWVQIPGVAKDIGIGADGSVWSIGDVATGGGFTIFKWNVERNDWDLIDGGAVRITVDPSGLPWVVNDAGNIWRRTTSGWLRLPGAAVDIGAGADGSVWVVGTNSVDGGYGIYKWLPDTSSWGAIDGGATRIAVDRDGNPWVVNDAGSVYKRVDDKWVQLPRKAKDVGAGAGGTIWAYGESAESAQQKNWVPIDGAAVYVSVDPAGNPWVVNNANQIFQRADNVWNLLPGAANDIGVGGDGTVWVIGTNQVGGGYGIYKWIASLNNWQGIDGGATRVAVDPNGLPWVVNDVGNIWQRTGEGWVLHPGSAVDIGVGADGSVWVIGTNQVAGGYGIYKWNSDDDTWSGIDGGAVRIAVDQDGNPWVVNDAGNIYQRTNDAWVQLPGAAQDIGVGADGNVWVIGTDTSGGGYRIYHLE